MIALQNHTEIETANGGNKWRCITITQLILAWQVPKICANLIEHLKKIIFSDEFSSRYKRSKNHFTRNRLLPFPIMMLFLMNLLKGSIQDELDHFFKAIKGMDVAMRIVTKSAFCRARKKIKYQAFVELTQHIVSFFYEHFSIDTWQGFRLLAIDSSTIKLPDNKQVAEHFGQWKTNNGKACPLARVSHMFDVLNKITTHALLSPHRRGERLLAVEHIQALQCKTDKALVLLDRGYPAHWLFALMLSKNIEFCAKVKPDLWNVTRLFFASEKKQQTVKLCASFASTNMCEQLDLSSDPLTLRLIRIQGPDGQAAVLVTSLMDIKTYPHKIFKKLYHHRWPIEEDYKNIKCRIEIENFSGKSVQAIYQDFHAKIFTKNLLAALVHPCKKTVALQSRQRKRQYKYQTNHTQAVSKIKDSVVLLFLRSNIAKLLNMLNELFIKTIEPIRLNRKYPRRKGAKMDRFNLCYKPVR